MVLLKFLLMLVYNMLSKLIISLFLSFFISYNIFSIERLPDAFNYSKVDEKLNSTVLKDIKLLNHKNETVYFGDFYDNKPIVINLAYYTCPKLCHLITDSLVQTLNLLSKKNIDELTVLTISFDDTETIETVNNFRDKYFNKLKSDFKDSIQWEFLYTDSQNISKLTNSLGYNFFYNTKSEQFSHPSVLIFLGPSGKITRYLYGIVFDIFDFKLSLFESKKNKTLSTVESMLLFCYNYDPDEKGYVLEAVRLMKAAGLLTVLFLFIFIYKLSRNN